MKTLNQAVKDSLLKFETAKGGNDPAMSINTANLYLRAIKSIETGIQVHGEKALPDISFNEIVEILKSAPSPNKEKEAKKALVKVFSLNDTMFPKPKKEVVLCTKTLEDAVDDTSPYILKMEKEHLIKEPTARAYSRQLHKVLESEFYAEHKNTPLNEIPKQAFEKYMALYAHGASAHNQALSMFRIMEKANGCEIKALINWQTKEVVVESIEGQYMTVAELEEMFAKPGKTDKEIRENAVAAIVVATLATTEELQELKFKDVAKKEVTLIHRPSLSGMKMMVPSVLYRHLKRYIENIKERFEVKESTPLFFNPHNMKPLSRNLFWQILHSGIERLGYRKASKDARTGAAIQCLRVSAARKLYIEGFDEELLSKIAQVKDFHRFIKLDAQLQEKRKATLENSEAYKKRG